MITLAFGIALKLAKQCDNDGFLWILAIICDCVWLYHLGTALMGK
jgi:hypothetical protein